MSETQNIEGGGIMRGLRTTFGLASDEDKKKNKRDKEESDRHLRAFAKSLSERNPDRSTSRKKSRRKSRSSETRSSLFKNPETEYFARNLVTSDKEKERQSNIESIVEKLQSPKQTVESRLLDTINRQKMRADRAMKETKQVYDEIKSEAINQRRQEDVSRSIQRRVREEDEEVKEDDDYYLSMISKKPTKSRVKQEQSNHFVCLVGTHNNRLKCIINKLFDHSSLKTRVFGSFYEMIFQNCCILRVDMNHIRDSIFEFSVKMIYSGELNKEYDNNKNKQFWKSSDDDKKERQVKKGWIYNKTVDKYITFPDFSGTIDLNHLNDIDLGPLKRISLNTSKNYTFFLCRHGEGLHNTPTKSNLLNAPLTKEGVRQAERAGSELREYLKNNHLTIDFLFASDLQRTQYTVGSIYSKIHSYVNSRHPDIYILPCSHEIVGLKGRCDNAGDITWAENKPTMTDKTLFYAEYEKYLNWDYYNSGFSRINKKTKTQLCRNTNMFIQMIHMIHNIGKLSGGRTRKNRKRRRKTKRY
jgi:phosphohistidine phosphatase SixA